MDKFLESYCRKQNIDDKKKMAGYLQRVSTFREDAEKNWCYFKKNLENIGRILEKIRTKFRDFVETGRLTLLISRYTRAVFWCDNYLTPADEIRIFGQHIDDFTFTFVAPLCAQNDCHFVLNHGAVWHEHCIAIHVAART